MFTLEITVYSLTEKYLYFWIYISEEILNNNLVHIKTVHESLSQ